MKILYLINVEWEWIFQRPQILELQLEKDFDSYVVCKKTLGRKVTTQTNVMPKNKIVAWQLPKEHCFKIIKKVNKILYKKAIGKINKYDIIWICDPMLYECIPNDYKGKIIYDCMDDHISMADNAIRTKMKELEDKLIYRADLIFSSSQKLIDDKMNNKKAILVRNGFIEQKRYDVAIGKRKEEYSIGYFGTIAEWFDFDLIDRSAANVKNINYYIIGPMIGSVKERVQSLNEKIHFEGVVEHSELYNYIDEYDAMFMPFKVNDIILAVDPVKLYEYISYGKCIISVWYPEIERFRPFVYFYETYEEYKELLDELVENGFKPKYDSNMQNEFLKQNSWENRYVIIKNAIDEI